MMGNRSNIESIAHPLTPTLSRRERGKKEKDDSLILPLPPGEGRGEGWHRPTTLKAQRLRKNPTEAEKLLWQKLRARQLNGFKFKRQYPLWNYAVIRFWNHEVLENIDGVLHSLSLTLSRRAGEGTKGKQ